MKRKETTLEKYLILNLYKLHHKTYKGKHSDKIGEYVYEKTNGETTFSVYLDKTRTRITYYSFTNNYLFEFSKTMIESLQGCMEYFTNELKSFYDFENECAIEDYQLPCNNNSSEEPFVEESYFDER